MENENKQKELKVTPATIDKDVLEEMVATDEQIKATMENPKLLKRAVLNGFCEMFAQIKELRVAIEEQNNILTTAFHKNIAEWLGKIDKNVEKEEKIQQLKKKIGQSHKKSTKTIVN